MDIGGSTLLERPNSQFGPNLGGDDNTTGEAPMTEAPSDLISAIAASQAIVNDPQITAPEGILTDSQHMT